MKFVRFEYNAEEKLGILNSDETRVVSISSVLNGKTFTDMNDLIERISEDEIKLLKEAYREESKSYDTYPINEVGLLSPIEKPRHDIICIGLNYQDHIDEMKHDFSNEPVEKPKIVYFSKRANRILGSEENLYAHFDIDDRLDYEVELAVIIGKEGYKIPKDKVDEYIFGYSVFNDFSSRKLQGDHIQWYRGKSLDGYSAMGPSILYKDELSSPIELDISTKVNGEIRQESNTRYFLNDIPSIISEISNGITLEAGDIIATGTPSGVAMGFDPPKYLKRNDVVECEIEKIGRLVNVIK